MRGRIMSATRLSLAMLASCALLGFAPAQAAEQSAPQGDSWESIAKLPDWSGRWESYREPGQGNPRDAMGPIPLTPEFDRILKAMLKQSEEAGHDVPSNTKLCIPTGLPDLMMRVT